MNDVAISVKPSIARLVNLALFFMFVILAVDFINLSRSQPLAVLGSKASFFLYVPVLFVSVFFWQKFRSRYRFVVYHNGIRSGDSSRHEEIPWEHVQSLDYRSVRYSKAFALTWHVNDKKRGILLHHFLTENFKPAVRTVFQYLPEDRITGAARAAALNMKIRNET